ncbi:MAG TPA: hypothetical protein PKE16_15985 [Hyphomicrobium sp.]|nr:hypothetical protein [Hyphomicrobium sp.]
MSSGKSAARASLFADVSFADLWRAVRYHQSGHQGLPTALEVAYASRFAAPSQPSANDSDACDARTYDSYGVRRAA